MATNVKKIYFDISTNGLINVDNDPVQNTDLFPNIFMGENGALLNIQFVQNQDSTDAYTELPAAATAQAVVDLDYSNPVEYNAVKSGETNWTASGDNDEYYFTGTTGRTLSADPYQVYINSILSTEGTVGALGNDEWGYSDSKLYVKLTDTTSPDTKASGYVSYVPTYTPVYIQSLADKFNQDDTWEDGGSFRNPVLADGEVTFQLYANTDDYAERIGTSSEAANTNMQIQFFEAVTSNLFNVYEFKFRCLNRYLPNTYTPGTSPSSYYTKTECIATFVNRGKFNLDTATNLQIATGVITCTNSIHTIEPETSTTDDLVTINGLVDGYNCFLYANDSADIITFKHGTGNILTPDGLDYTMTGNEIVMISYDGSNVRILGGVDTDVLVPKSLFDANTILAANTDNTPAALTVAEQRLVGRITAGNITALTAAEVKTMLAIVASDLSDFDAEVSNNSSVADNTTHRGLTNNPHATDIENLGAGTLAELNAAISDATLIDTTDSRLSDARDPNNHASNHTDGTDDIVSFTGTGTKGVVPNPGSETGKYLEDDGTWTSPPGSDLTTKGDLECFTTVQTRFPIGVNGTSLVVDDTQASGFKWSTPAGGGDVLAPATNTDNYIPQWNGVDSKTLKDGLVLGIADDALVQIDGADIATGEYAKFTANGLQSKTFTEVKTDLSLNNVENTALSTWTGTSNLETYTTSFTVAISNETSDLTTGTAKLTFRMPYAMTLTDVRSSVGTAPTDATLIIDINETGSTILSTKLSIDATEKTSTTAAVPVVISDSALADDAEITIDIDQIGSTIAGAGAKVTFIGTRL